ncbi:MAG: PIN domain-containing protein [Acidobacteria bacterium]|nr:PIN domain-containing protein [Acidobacteriota bacterium]
MIVDTGVLVAAADSSDPHFEEARAILESGAEKMVTDAILSEAHHLIASRAGKRVAAAFLESIDHDLFVECSTRSDRARAGGLCRKYLDARMDYTDALTVAIAERIGERVIATLDPRHFRIVRPRHAPAFNLIP